MEFIARRVDKIALNELWIKDEKHKCLLSKENRWKMNENTWEAGIEWWIWGLEEVLMKVIGPYSTSKLRHKIISKSNKMPNDAWNML